MSNMEADDNDADGDLIFISEEHIDLEDSIQLKREPEEIEEEDANADAETDAANTADDAELEPLDDAEQEEEEEEGHDGEHETEEHEEKLEDKNVVKDVLMVVDEWDDDEMESEPEDEVKEKDEEALNPEDVERSLLHMPPLKSVLDDIGHLRQNRRIVIHPLTLDEIEHPKLKEVIATDACEEVKFHFVRSKGNDKLWTGIAVLNFMTKGSAVQAIEEVKEIKENVDVKLETNTNIIVEHFVKESKADKRWTDNVLVVRNLTEDVKLESLKELFPDAEEVVIHKETSKHRDATVARGYAYLLYQTDVMATSAAKEYEQKKVMMDGNRLSILPYRLPIDNLPPDLLRLRQRKLVFKHLDKLTKLLEKATDDPTAKVPETAKQRIERCKAVIEKDNKARKDVNLETPSYEEMKQLDGLPPVSAGDCHRFLVRLGIIDKPKKKEEGHSLHKHDRSKSPPRYGDKNLQRPYRKAPSPRNMRRNSPRKRNWGQGGGRNPRTGPGNILRSDRNAAGIGGVINPLALWQQGLMGTGALINPGMLMQPNMGAAFLGAGGLIGNVQQPNLPFMGGLGPQMPPGRGMEEPSAKMLRLDEAGNFRATEGRRFQEREYHRRNEGHHHRGREREDRMPMRDIRPDRPQRSRSPDRSGRSGQHSDMRYNDMPTSGMGREPVSGRGGEEGEISNQVNLLFNLSQMLSQKMEQKRQLVERDRRGYDRNDYGHGGQR